MVSLLKRILLEGIVQGNAKDVSGDVSGEGRDEKNILVKDIMIKYLITIVMALFLIAVLLGIFALLEPKRRAPRVTVHGCLGSRWGCCPDRITTKEDPNGTNCVNGR